MQGREKNINNNKLAIFWVLFGALSRLVPHFPNVTPMTSLSLFAGSKLTKATACAVLLLTMLISDMLLAFIYGYPIFSYWTLFSYSGFAFMILLGTKLKGITAMRRAPVYILSSSLGFWLWTNFGVWLTSGLYPKSLAGIAFCYEAALPFLRNSMLGDMVWGLVIFGTFQVVRKKARI